MRVMKTKFSVEDGGAIVSNRTGRDLQKPRRRLGSIKMNTMTNLHGELQDAGSRTRTVRALVHADGREKAAAVMSHEAVLMPLKDSSRDWNTLIVICASTVLIAVLIVIEFVVLPR